MKERKIVKLICAVLCGAMLCGCGNRAGTEMPEQMSGGDYQ